MSRQTVYVLMYDNLPFRVFPGTIDEERKKELIDAHKAVVAREFHRCAKDPQFAWYPFSIETRKEKAEFRAALRMKIEAQNIHFRRVVYKDR